MEPDAFELYPDYPKSTLGPVLSLHGTGTSSSKLEPASFGTMAYTIKNDLIGFIL